MISTFLLTALQLFSQELVTADSSRIYIENTKKKDTYYEGVKQNILLSDLNIQIDATQAVNDMYNFKFEKAEQQFRWLKQKYPWHPLPYFLRGLSEWWKIMPELENEQYDESFYTYMDSAIWVAEKLYDMPSYKIEGAFFLSAGYAFKGRLLAERKKWGKSADAGSKALKYLNVSKGNEELSPELLFGDALYNYYREWIPENYPMLKIIMWMFPGGDRDLGLKQLETVSRNAFYTRTEAQVFLMRLLYNEENKKEHALQISEYLAKTFPGNSYLQRYYARMLYSMGRYKEAEPVALKMLEKVEGEEPGYNDKTGKYASFFLAQINQGKRNHDKAKYYYQQAIEYGKKEDGLDTGYSLYSAYYLARYASAEGDHQKYNYYYKMIKDNTKNKDEVWKQMKEFNKKQGLSFN